VNATAPGSVPEFPQTGGESGFAPRLAPAPTAKPAKRAKPARRLTARKAAPTGRHAARRAPRKRRLAVVYDVDGPRVRLGVGWFAVALAGIAAGPVTAALVYCVAAAWAGRQIVRAWGSVAWQADLAAGLAGVPVLAALGGTRAVVGALVLAALVAVVAACTPGAARFHGAGGRVAGLVILLIATIPAIAGASVVLVRSESRSAALVLLLLVSAYEMGDFIVGSGASNPVEGPLAGMTTATLLALPLAVLLVAPFDAAGAPLLGLSAAACPLGQVVASAMLPDAGATAPALRRIDTLLVLGPLWATAAAAF
jgi:hypothetical protein